MTEHTPGPWNIQVRNTANSWMIVDAETDTWVATASSKANARLIAAAPETADERDRLNVAFENSGRQIAKIVGANKALLGKQERLTYERDSLKALNEELLAALEDLVASARGMPICYDNLCQGNLDCSIGTAQAVIEKHEDQP